DSEEVLAWYDNRVAAGVNAVTFSPETAGPTVAQRALGITTRDGSRGGANHRVTFIENDGTIFDGIGVFLTGTYNNAGVRAPDGAPGMTASVFRVNDPAFYPRNLNAAGAGMFGD